MDCEHNDTSLQGAIEALLFVSDEPVSVIDLARILKVDASVVENALLALRDEAAEQGRGIQLCEVAGGWRMFTHPQYHDLIERYVISWDARKLSSAALETLAIIAYCQPVTRAQVASIRGVSSDSSINSLVEKGLVREAGTADTPGNPMQYATTRTFLERFGLASTADLPDVREFAPDQQTRDLIAKRLRVTVRESSQENSGFFEQTQTQMQAQTLDSLAAGFGLVDKIDLSQLTFEDEDEYLQD